MRERFRRTARAASALEHWTARAEAYAPPHGHGLVRLAARSQHAAILRLLEPIAGQRILDAGCGTGLLTSALIARDVRVWATDFCPAMVEQVRGAERALCANVETLSLGVRFDAIACAGVLNFADARRALARLATHLRPGGRLVVSVTRLSPLGLCYALTRWLRGIPFELWSARALQERAREVGLVLRERTTCWPHDAVLAFERM
jgi:2-polyprenyl-3-methyl-5-hydroxy-6-metoxy-1,4-benzoquinol methylase